MDLESQIRRFEQQLAAFETLHTDELRGLEEKLAAYKALHADEVQLLRQELARVRTEVEALQAEAAEGHRPDTSSAAPMSRRDLLLRWMGRENKAEE